MSIEQPFLSAIIVAEHVTSGHTSDRLAIATCVCACVQCACVYVCVCVGGGGGGGGDGCGYWCRYVKGRG